MAKRYRRYKGKPHGRSFFPVFIAVLILVASIVILFMVLQDSIVFTSDGIRLENPFGSAKPSASPSIAPSQEPDLVIVTPSSTPTPTPTPTQTQPSAPASDLTVKAIYIPDPNDQVAIAGAIQLADKGTINTVVLNMKPDDGTLSYISSSKYALDSGANPKQSSIAKTISDLKDSGLHLIARMSAFKDNIVPRKNQTTSVKVKSGVIWLDRDYHGWLNPYKSETQDYIIDISTELADMGFDEILLDNFTFPTIGRPQLIHYGEYEETSKIDTLNYFAEILADKLSSKDSILAITVSSSSIINGADTATGQDPATLYTKVNRLFTETGKDPETASSLYSTIIGITGTDTADDLKHAFVPIIRSPRRYDDPSASENIQTAIGAFGQTSYGWLILDPSGLYPSSGW